MNTESELVDYIRKNHEIYSRDAINQRLADEGYTEAEIEAAWKLAEQADGVDDGVGEAQAHQAGTASGTPVGGCFVALYVVIFIFGFFLLVLTDAVLGSSSYYYPALGVTEVVVNVLSVAVAAGLLVGSIMLLRRGWEAGRVTALMAAVALFWFLIMTGTCLYAPSALR